MADAVSPGLRTEGVTLMVSMLKNRWTGLWLLLIALTGFSARFAEARTITIGIVVLTLIISVVKASVLVEYFMGLREAPLLWRGLLLAYVPVIAAIITLTYLF